MSVRLISRLKEYRSGANLTQAQLAEIVGVSRKTINTVENEIYVPSTMLALQLAQALGCSVHDIFELKED